ncbi:MAG: tRNA (adenosine(37)-N6)-threonylcarbamoyltransferase complex dimerization subunit type 1 TsaB [Deltaproteobacteria bacterium]
MLTLAFDTSSKTASVSLLRDQTVLYDTVINKGLNHSEVLLPAIDEACRLTGTGLKEIDLFACTLGPGSFTGLRIGISTLKGFMVATGKPAAGVSTLAALALNVDQKEKVIGSMMDAGRGQVYLAYYRYDQDGILKQLEEERALDPQSIVDYDQDEVIYVGDGAIKYADVIRTRLNHKNKMASPAKQFICASAVGILAIEKYRRNDLLDVASCVPVYLRSADAIVKKQMVF